MTTFSNLAPDYVGSPPHAFLSMADLIMRALSFQDATLLGSLVADSIRTARKFVVFPDALHVVQGLPDRKWSDAVAGAWLRPGAQSCWVESSGHWLAGPASFTVSGAGILLNPRIGLWQGVQVLLVAASLENGVYAVNDLPINDLRLFARDAAVADLAAAYGLLLSGDLVGVANQKSPLLNTDPQFLIMACALGAG